jgi:hypothetical protein
MTQTNITSLLRFCLQQASKCLSASLMTGFVFACFSLTDVSVAQGQVVRRANLNQESASAETKKMADWVVDSSDNQGRPFVIIDKKEAKVFVFQANGALRGAAPVLLGITVGDDSFPGVGDKPLHEVKPEEKTTPAGRFVAASDKNVKGANIVWIDYDSAVSMHAVVKGTEAERRAERLASPSPLDRRISYGCVNVPVHFFNTTLLPSFKKSDGIVYVLPETRDTRDVFRAFYDVDQREKQSTVAAQQDDDPIARFATKR